MTTQHDCLPETLASLRSERAGILVQGRALTPEEEARVRTLEDAIGHIEAALAVLGTEPPADGESLVLRDGSYLGGNGEFRIDLRVDAAGSSMISADVYRIGFAGDTWLASLRTEPGESVGPTDTSWSIVVDDQEGRVSRGRLELSAVNAEPFTLAGSFEVDEPIAGIPRAQKIGFTASWSSQALRSLGIETETQDGLGPQASYERSSGDVVTVDTCFLEAGFEVFEAGSPGSVPKPPTPWGTTQLHAVMEDHAQASLQRPAWELHLLRLDRSSRPGLLGIMFDTTAQLPRQGTAVFEGEILARVQTEVERKIIQTTVHELGHALNLAHRFERVVGRADSTSFMNYDWRYRGGGRKSEFWRNFQFRFDDDEIAFLRHGPRRAVIPGGRAFHSVPYWSDASGGYTPYYPEVPIPGLDLELSGPQGGNVFDFLQPVFLMVELHNQTGETLNLPRWLLDPKSGALDIVVRRVHGGQGPTPPATWVPVLQRCRDMAVGVADFVPDGGTLRRNLNLTFGAAGFTFVEPGEYEIQAVISLPQPDLDRELVVPSNRIRIRVGAPRSREEEEDALVLARGDVGLYFALGGSRALETAHADLEEVKKRRQRRAKGAADPVVANIIRCDGIDSGRAYLRKREGKYAEDPGDRARAARLLKSLDDRALLAFDAETAATTRDLAAKHARASGGSSPKRSRRR